jgi:hypothetical protein
VGDAPMRSSVAIDMERLIKRLAEKKRLTDYDLWRASRDIDNALYALDKAGDPIPMDLLRARAAVREARSGAARRGR